MMKIELDRGGEMDQKRTIIRWATEQDAGDLVRLNNEFNGVGMTTEGVKESLTQSNELVALAVIEDNPVGFACAQYFKSFCYRNLYGEITEMYINEAARGRGLATLLISFLEVELQSRGVRRVKVITGIKNEVAIRTYEKSQYTKEDDLILHKKLG
jgi:ribosomal protein S18 acetylase RimI-like enzyme